MKKSLLLLSFPLLAASLVSCGGSSSSSITVWTFSNELKKIASDFYKPATGKDVKVVIKSSVTQIQSDLENAIKSGRGVPDAIALEAAVVADFTSKSSTESSLLALDDIAGTDQMYPYTKSVATSTDGKLLGLSWQATPGGFFYKKSVAAKVGITSIEQMEAKISTWEGYLDLASQCKAYDLDESKDGIQSIAICSSITDPVKVFLSAREKAWVVDNVLQMEEVMFGGTESANCFDVVRSLQQEGYTHESSDRGPMWVTDINSTNTLGYFCSSWGLNFDLIPNATSTVGDWQMCKAPVNYFKGGTWLAVPKLASNPSDAKEFIKYVVTNEDFLLRRGRETGDFMNNKRVMQQLIADYSCDFLGGQNHLGKLYEVAESINGDLISPYDASIDAFFTTSVANFARDEASTPEELAEARDDKKADFITSVRAKYKTITIPE